MIELGLVGLGYLAYIYIYMYTAFFMFKATTRRENSYRKKIM